MRQAPYRLRIGQEPVADFLQTVTFDIPRQLDYEGFSLQFTGVITNSVAWTALKTQSVFGLVRRIELLLNGQTVVEQVGGFELASLTIGLSRGLALSQAPWITAPGFTAAAHSFRVQIPIDRSMFDMVRPKDTALASRDLSTIQMRVTVGQLSDLYTGAGTGVLSSSSMTLYADALQEYPTQDGRISVPPYLLKRTQQDVAIVSSNQNLQVKLPVGNLLRRVMFVERTSGDVLGSLLNNVQLVRGSDIRANMNKNFLLDHTASLAAVQLNSGVTVVDFAKRRGALGKIADCWSLAGAADVYAVLDVTASGANPAISVVTEELIPRMARAA